MWSRYVLVAVIAVLFGAIIGGLILAARGGGGQPAIAVLEPASPGVQARRFVIANPKTGMVSVYEVGLNDISMVGSARY